MSPRCQRCDHIFHIAERVYGEDEHRKLAGPYCGPCFLYRLDDIDKAAFKQWKDIVLTCEEELEAYLKEQEDHAVAMQKLQHAYDQRLEQMYWKQV